jgi:signal transduction histidine kinase
VTRSALAPGAGLVGLVYRTGQPQIIHDAAGEVAQLPWPYPELNAGRSRSAIGVPLISDARPIGVLMAANSSSTGAFSAHDLRVLQPLAVKAANSIENARLYEQVRAGREQLRRLSLQLMEAQEAERRSLAAELHDEIGQVLTAIKTNLQATQLQPDPSTLTRRLQDSIAIVDRALEQVRELALDLRPSLLDDFGLVAALEWLVERLGERSGIRAEFLAEPHDLRLAPAVETAFFRIAQAALTNVERHAQAKRVRVELRRVPVPPAEAPGRVELVISDDGQGFEVPAAMEHAVRGASLGLLGMQERVRQAGGEIAIESEPGRGTTVRVTYPAGA